MEPPSPFELEDAVEAGDLATVRALLEGGADPNALCHGLDTPVVELAFSRSDLAMVELFHRYGADLEATSSSPLLHEHAWRCEANPVLALLLRLGWDPDARDEAGWTALHHAVAVGYTANVETLLAAGADRHARTEDGLTPVDIATGNNRIGIASLVQRGDG